MCCCFVPLVAVASADGPLGERGGRGVFLLQLHGVGELSDERHAGYRDRPAAQVETAAAIRGGRSVGRQTEYVVAALLSGASLAILPVLPREFAVWLGLYIVATVSYSLYLKRLVVVDVLLLSGLYTVRLLAGGAATGTAISQWLAGFSRLLFLSLAMLKRFSELENLRERGAKVTNGRGYLVGDLDQIRSFGTASAYAAVVVFMLYIGRPDVTELYRHASRLWLIVPC